MRKDIENHIKNSIKAKECVLEDQVDNIENAANAIIESLKAGKKLIVFGNGGSAADSMHIAAELVGRFRKERKALSAIALTDNISTLTALGNDKSIELFGPLLTRVAPGAHSGALASTRLFVPVQDVNLINVTWVG